MSRSRPVVLMCAWLVGLGCSGDDGAAAPGTEAGDATGAADVGTDTGEPSDVADGPSDATDTGAADTGAPDTGAADTGAADTGAADTGAADTGAADTGAADTGAADTGEPPPPVWTDLPPGYEQAHFEGIEVDSAGATADLTLPLAEGTLGFAVMLSGAPDGVWMRLNKAVVPPGFPVVKSQGSVTCETCPNRVYASQILNTSLFPNTPDVAYKTKGNYKLGARQFSITPLGGSIAVAPWSGTPLTVRVLMKTWDAETPPSAGTFDLNLFFTGVHDITAGTAPGHPRIQAMLQGIDAAYETAGIQVGEVRYFDTPEGTPTAVETNIDTDSDLAALFSASVGAPPGLNVFFVSSIVKTEVEDQSAGIVLGIAGGIPGPPFTHQGSLHSGVALALDDIPSDPEGLGPVCAHELGHYLGLYHTIEKDGQSFDPIGDTPEEGSDNLMYWAYTGSDLLSEGQTFVVLRHPSVWLTPAGP